MAEGKGLLDYEKTQFLMEDGKLRAFKRRRKTCIVDDKGTPTGVLDDTAYTQWLKLPSGTRPRLMTLWTLVEIPIG